MDWLGWAGLAWMEYQQQVAKGKGKAKDRESMCVCKSRVFLIPDLT